MSWTVLGPGLVLSAYLLGSISFSLLIVRALRGFDLRDHGSGNAGASNVLRLAGKGPAVVVVLLDVAKGVVPIQVARALEAPGAVLGAAAVAAVVGHIFPLFHGFRGGKGVATVTGALGSLALIPAGLALGVFSVLIAATRYISVASVVTVACFPLLLYLRGLLGWAPPPPGWLMISAIIIAALVAAKHSGNFRRLAAGTENRLGNARGTGAGTGAGAGREAA